MNSYIVRRTQRYSLLLTLAILSSFWFLGGNSPAQPGGVEPVTSPTSPTDEPKDIAPALAALAGEASAGSPAGGADLGNNRFNYQADLFTGRFAYSIPIIVAPGRQGAQPTLALTYNSAGGNGWCGVGWSLEVGFIQRETRYGVPIKWSPPSALNEYDDAKGFIANFGGVSSPLVLVGATNQNPIEYRQAVETAFLRYKYYSDNHWEVTDKGGNTFYFGEGGTNRMENTKSGWTAGAGASTFRWALNKVIDINGNQTVLSYTKDGGLLYLTNISYNANINSPSLSATHSVDFSVTGRSDTNITFQTGYRVETRKLLSQIDVKASGSLVRRYQIAYTNSPSTLRSLLRSVAVYGSDGATPLPPMTFDYSVKPFGFESATNWPIYSQGQTSYLWNTIRTADWYSSVDVMDMDSDGLPDRVMEKVDSPYTNYFAIQRNTGTGFVPASSFNQLGALFSQGQTSYSWNGLNAIDCANDQIMRLS